MKIFQFQKILGNRFIKLFLTFLVLFFISCNKEDEESYVAPEYSCLIINMGNYSEANGSISLLNVDKTIEHNVYEKANGWKLAAIIESGFFYKDMLLLMCSNENKIEILDKKSFKVISDPIRNIGIPRYCAVYNNMAYITTVDSWDSNVGHIYKIDLNTKTVVNKIDVSGTPEGIKELDGLLYVAVQNSLIIVDPKTDKIIRTIHVPDDSYTAKHIVVDCRGVLWISFTVEQKKAGAVASFEPDSDDFSSFIPLDGMAYAGILDMTPDKKTLMYLYCLEVVGGVSPEPASSICAFDVTSNAKLTVPIVNGKGFYGFNLDPSNGAIYTANVNGFMTNSMMYVFNSDGNILINGLMTGVGTCRFMFP